jgi:hypothetical protein
MTKRSGLSWEAGECILQWAHVGDWESLALYIHVGGPIRAEMRAFIVEVLRGRKKRPNNRAPKWTGRVIAMSRAIRVLLAMEAGTAREVAIDEAASGANVDRRTIQRDLEKYEDLLWDDRERTRKGTLREGEYSVRYKIDRTALTPYFMS